MNDNEYGARESYTADCVTDGGGEASATGNTLAYQTPNVTDISCRVEQIRIDNGTGTDIRVLLTDLYAIATVMPAAAEFAFEIPAGEHLILDEADLGYWDIKLGIVYQSSEATSGTGVKVRVTVRINT